MIPRKGLQAYSWQLFYQMNSFTGIIHILYMLYILFIYIIYIIYIRVSHSGGHGGHVQLKNEAPKSEKHPLPPPIKT